MRNYYPPELTGRLLSLPNPFHLITECEEKIPK